MDRKVRLKIHDNIRNSGRLDKECICQVKIDPFYK